MKGQAPKWLRSYAMKLRGRVLANVAYPEEMKNKGITGLSIVTFTITKSGEIKEGSLKVRTSSGFQPLDSSALKAVRVSAPFEAPPKELGFVIPVKFLIGTPPGLGRGKSSSNTPERTAD
jgi:protein TonB